MAELIQYSDGVSIEIVNDDKRARPVSMLNVDKVKQKYADAVKAIEPIVQPIIDMVSKVTKRVEVTESEIELGLSFTAEGNLYLIKSEASASVKVKIKMKVKP